VVTAVLKMYEIANETCVKQFLSIMLDLKGIGCGDVGWIPLVQVTE
jgi:hypothetical protein